jgi:hypothetical protein
MTSTPNSATTMASDMFPSAPAAQMTIPPAMMSTSGDPWDPSTASAASARDTQDGMPDVQQHGDFAPGGGAPQPQRETNDEGNGGGDAPSELNNAFEGAMDGLGLDNGLDYGMGIDMNMWTPGNGEWSAGNEFMSGSSVGV